MHSVSEREWYYALTPCSASNRCERYKTKEILLGRGYLCELETNRWQRNQLLVVTRAASGWLFC